MCAPIGLSGKLIIRSMVKALRDREAIQSVFSNFNNSITNVRR